MEVIVQVLAVRTGSRQLLKDRMHPNLKSAPDKIRRLSPNQDQEPSSVRNLSQRQNNSQNLLLFPLRNRLSMFVLLLINNIAGIILKLTHT